MTLKELVELMVDQKTNTVLVVSPEKKFLGLVTSKDLIMGILPDFMEDKSISSLMGEGDFEQAVKESEDVQVKDFMNTKIKPVQLDEPIVRIAVSVIDNNESRLPVVDEQDQVIGIITRTHIKRAVATILGIED
jgi:CBS domain-containing protein